MYFPLGENLTKETGGLSSSTSVLRHFPVAVSHIRLSTTHHVTCHHQGWVGIGEVWVRVVGREGVYEVRGEGMDYFTNTNNHSMEYCNLIGQCVQCTHHMPS